jgi:hypothetical protein
VSTLIVQCNTVSIKIILGLAFALASHAYVKDLPARTSNIPDQADPFGWTPAPTAAPGIRPCEKTVRHQPCVDTSKGMSVSHDRIEVFKSMNHHPSLTIPPSLPTNLPKRILRVSVAGQSLRLLLECGHGKRPNHPYELQRSRSRLRCMLISLVTYLFLRATDKGFYDPCDANCQADSLIALWYVFTANFLR